MDDPLFIRGAIRILCFVVTLHKGVCAWTLYDNAVHVQDCIKVITERHTFRSFKEIISILRSMDMWKEYFKSPNPIRSQVRLANSAQQSHRYTMIMVMVLDNCYSAVARRRPKSKALNANNSFTTSDEANREDFLRITMFETKRLTSAELCFVLVGRQPWRQR